jgi:hypothetical protein
LVTFTRASDGTFVDSAGVLQTAATNVPRFDHNPTTGESLGLLVEEQRTNLLLNSEDFSGATTFRGSITANVIAAPDGATTADLFTENTETGNHTTQFGSIAFTTGVTYTVSIFLRPNGRDTNIRFRGTNTTTFAAEAFFNLTGAGAVASTVFGTASIQALPNGWYRCIITGVSGATNTTGIQVLTSSGAGDGTSGVYIWGAQLEAGAFPTSYIPTTAAGVTRSADVASITNANLLPWFTSSLTDHTFYVEARSGGTTASVTLEGYEGASLKGLSITVLSRPRMIQRHGASRFDTASQAADIGLGNRARIAVVTSSNSSSALNGSAVSGAAPTQTDWTVGSSLSIGSRAAGASSFFTGTIQRLTYWPLPLANSTLQGITS